jgi:hypothetical protein
VLGGPKMRLGALVLLAPAACVIFVCWLLPANTFVVFKRPDRGTITVSRSGVELGAPPDRYPADGFAHIEPYVSKLLVPSSRIRWVSIFTPAGDRGLALHANGMNVELHLTVEWRAEPKREAAIRSFFAARDIGASEDYLAGNGGVPDATRLLAYPIAGGATEVTALTKRALQELCGVSPSEPLDIGFTER